MALIRCPECKNEISDLSAACPHCGYPISGSSPAPGSVVVPRGFALVSAVLASLLLALSAVFTIVSFAPVSPPDLWFDFFGAVMYLGVFFLTAGVALNWSGYMHYQRYCVMTSGICYCVSAVLLFPFFIFFVFPIVFSFIGFAMMKPRRVVSEEYYNQ